MSSFRKNIILIIKPTNACIASCVYCSAYKPGKGSEFMSHETLENLVRKLAEYADKSELESINFTWHGGEPLLAGDEFYERAIELQDKFLSSKVVLVKNSMQSNLLPLTEKKAELLTRLLRTADVSRSVIGSSFDPLPGIRILPGGDYETRWRESVAILASHGIRVGAIYVVHKASLAEVERIFNCFEYELPIVQGRINPIYAQGRGAFPSSERFHVTPLEWGEFMVSFYRLWEESGKKKRYFPFSEWDDFHNGVSAALSCDCSGGGVDNHIGIDVDGTVFCCGRCIDGGTMPYGNINKDAIRTLIESPCRQSLRNRFVKLRMSSCRNCDWWEYCHGGCPNDSDIAWGDISLPTPWCEGRKRFFQTVYKSPSRRTPVSSSAERAVEVE